MGEYEPDDSRIVTRNPTRTPIAPQPTGPRERGERQNDSEATSSRKPSEGETSREEDELERWQSPDRKGDG